MRNFYFSYCYRYFFSVNDERAQLSSFANADFELNSFANWTWIIGYCYPINSITPGIVAGRIIIMTVSGTDPNTNGAIIVADRVGQFSAYLGNEDVGAQAEQLSYQIAVDAMNALYIYRYTMELEDPSHTITNILVSQIKGPLKSE